MSSITLKLPKALSSEFKPNAVLKYEDFKKKEKKYLEKKSEEKSLLTQEQKDYLLELDGEGWTDVPVNEDIEIVIDYLNSIKK